MSLLKMKDFKSSMQDFETKYGLAFEDFKQQIKTAETEDFEKWDDYIEWKAYSKAYDYWKIVHFKKYGKMKDKYRHGLIWNKK